jgi:anti-sigma-K factor RskA
MDIQAYIESGVIESYVLGIAGEQEAAELEQLSRQFPQIKKAIDDFEASLEKAALAGAMPPPSYVKQELFTRLADEFKEAPGSRVGQLVSMPARSAFARYVAAAAIVLLVVSAAMNVYFYNRFRSTDVAYQALLVEKTSLLADNQISQAKALSLYQEMQMMSDPTVAKISMQGVAGRENNLATVFWDTKTKDVYLLANKLPQTPADKQYQLWAIVDGVPVDAGMMDACTGLCKMKNIPKAAAFAITLEKKGGVASPTMDQMYVLGKVG